MATALIGFHSATVRSHPGSPSAGMAEDAGPIDPEAVFERAVRRVLGGFEDRA